MSDLWLEWHDLVGAAGVAMIVCAYLLLQLKRIESAGLRYSLINGLGAAFVLVSLAFDFNLSAAMIEVFWLAISILGLSMWWKRQRRMRAPQSAAGRSEVAEQASQPY